MGRRHVLHHYRPGEAVIGRLVSAALGKFTDWALSKNPPGTYAGEDDKRWAYTIETAGDPYLTRVLLSRVLGLRDLLGLGVYLHRFHRPDADRWPHSHPWTWGFSIILRGSYDEERVEYVPTGRVGNLIGLKVLMTTRRVRFLNFLTRDDYHSVTKLHGDVSTLFVTGPRLPDDEWGFLVDGEHVPWRDYFKQRLNKKDGE